MTRLVRDFKTQISNAVQSVYDIENDQYDTPDSGSQVNAEYLYNGDLHDSLLDDTARAVIDNQPNTTRTDVAVTIAQLGMGIHILLQAVV